MPKLEVLTDYGCTTTHGRFLLYECDTFSDLRELEGLSRYFSLFTGFDLQNTSDVELLQTGKILVESGLAYACCWGASCERWHDAIDAAAIERSKRDKPSSNDVIMTSWHDDEAFKEALWFFLHAACPAGEYVKDCKDSVIATTREHSPLVRRVIRPTKFRPDPF